MHIVIDIPQDLYEVIRENDVGNVIYNAIKHGVVLIPHNPTNGDVIKALFPNTSTEKNGALLNVRIGDYITQAFTLAWWYAP